MARPRRLLVGVSALLAAAAAAPPPPLLRGYDIIIIAGQSNAIGRDGVLTDAERAPLFTRDGLPVLSLEVALEPKTAPAAGVAGGNATTTTTTWPAALVPARPAFFDFLGDRAPGAGIGLGVGFVQRYIASAAPALLQPGRSVLVVPAAVGGTSLSYWWSPDRRGPMWARLVAAVQAALAVELPSPGGTGGGGSDGMLSVVDGGGASPTPSARPSGPGASKTPTSSPTGASTPTPTFTPSVVAGNRVVALLWHQGEADGLASERAYHARLSAFVAAFRAMVRNASGGVPGGGDDDVPFIAGQLEPASSGGNAHKWGSGRAMARMWVQPASVPCPPGGTGGGGGYDGGGDGGGDDTAPGGNSTLPPPEPAPAQPSPPPSPSAEPSPPPSPSVEPSPTQTPAAVLDGGGDVPVDPQPAARRLQQLMRRLADGAKSPLSTRSSSASMTPSMTPTSSGTPSVSGSASGSPSGSRSASPSASPPPSGSPTPTRSGVTPSPTASPITWCPAFAPIPRAALVSSLGVKFMNADAGSTGSNTQHFDAASERELGRRYFEAYRWVVAQASPPPSPPPGVLPPKAGSAAAGGWPVSTVAGAQAAASYAPLPAALAPPRPCHFGYGFHGADYLPPGDDEYADVVFGAPPGDPAAAAALARRLTLTLRAPGSLPGAWFGPALPAAYRVKLVHTPVPVTTGAGVTRLPLLPPRTLTTLPDRDANSSAPAVAVCGCETYSPAALALVTGGSGGGSSTCANLPSADASAPPPPPLTGLLGALWSLPGVPSALVTPYMFNATPVVPLFNGSGALLQASDGTPVPGAPAVAAQWDNDALDAGRVLPASVSDDLTTLTLPVYRLPGYAPVRDGNWVLLVKPVALVPVTTGVDEPLTAATAGTAASAATALTPREPPWALAIAVPSATPPTTLSRTPTRTVTRTRSRTGSRTRSAPPTRSRTPPQTRSPSRSPPPPSPASRSPTGTRLLFTTPSRSRKAKV